MTIDANHSQYPQGLTVHWILHTDKNYRWFSELFLWSTFNLTFGYLLASCPKTWSTTAKQLVVVVGTISCCTCPHILIFEILGWISAQPCFSFLSNDVKQMSTEFKHSDAFLILSNDVKQMSPIKWQFHIFRNNLHIRMCAQ